MALWLVSLLVHFAGDAGQGHAGAAGLEGASFLLYLGRDAVRAVLRRVPAGPAAVGAARARRRPAAATCSSRRARAPSSPPSPHRRDGARARVPGRLARTGPERRELRRRSQHHRRRGGRGRRRPRPTRAARTALIVPTLGARDVAPQLQPAALRRPTRLDRAVAGAPRRVGRLGRGRDLRARRGPGRPAAVRGGTAPGRAGGAAAGPGALRRAVRHHPAADGPDGGAAGGPLRDDPGRRRRPARGVPRRVGGRPPAPEGGRRRPPLRSRSWPSSAGT